MNLILDCSESNFSIVVYTRGGRFMGDSLPIRANHGVRARAGEHPKAVSRRRRHFLAKSWFHAWSNWIDRASLITTFRSQINAGHSAVQTGYGARVTGYAVRRVEKRLLLFLELSLQLSEIFLHLLLEIGKVVIRKGERTGIVHVCKKMKGRIRKKKENIYLLNYP